MRYIPGGCTGIFQPCDVGIQRILKHAMKKTALSHIVKETVAHLNNNEDPGTILLTKAVKVLRNRLVEWLVNGYKAINKPEIVKKVRTSPPTCNLFWRTLIVQAWELCKVGEIYLSYNCLTSPEVRQTLVGLRNTNPILYEQLSAPPPSAPMPPPPPEQNGPYPEDQEHEDDEGFMDSSLSIDKVVSWIADEAPGELVDSSHSGHWDLFRTGKFQEYIPISSNILTLI